MNAHEVIKRICTDVGVTLNGNKPWDLKVHNPDFYNRVLATGSLGMGESYMQKWWDCDDLFGFFTRILKYRELGALRDVGWQATLASLRAKLSNIQTVSQSRELADTHYNLSNELFEHMLGPSMAYSCAYWKDADNLDDAQNAKFDLICRKLLLEADQRVLDIGCGWGGLAKYAAENYGIQYTGLTVAEEQAKYARDHCRDLPVDIVCCDYREFDPGSHGGPFDKIVSVGMIEHVGYRNYRALFDKVAECMTPDALFLLHTIGNTVTVKAGDPWISRYIFPGGLIPSQSQLGEAAENLLILHDLHNIGVHYTPTLIAWNDNFTKYWHRNHNAQLPTIWGSREAFYRMWRYYLMLCAANFATGECQVWQQVYARSHLENGYTAVR